MLAAIERTVKPLQRVHVVGFSTVPRAIAVYTGSCAWFLLLIVSQVVALATDNLAHDEIAYGALIGSTTLAFVLQTADVLSFHQRFWPLAALNWAAQLGGIGLAAALVGRALTEQEAPRVLACIGMLYAQCLFTASQFAVTLAYLHRASDQASALPAVPCIRRRRV